MYTGDPEILSIYSEDPEIESISGIYFCKRIWEFSRLSRFRPKQRNSSKQYLYSKENIYFSQTKHEIPIDGSWSRLMTNDHSPGPF